MKHILLLSLSFCLLSSLQAQNPYVELSYPWLNLQQVKDDKIKSIMLATVSAESAMVEKQIVLTFDAAGKLVKDENQSGFRFENAFLYNDAGFLTTAIGTYGNSADTTTYKYDQKANSVISQFVSKNTTGDWTVTETHYMYSADKKLVEIKGYSGAFDQMKKIRDNSLILSSTETFTFAEGKVISSSGEISKIFDFSPVGNLESASFTNSLYGISETYSYSYDQNNHLVMITWSQDGQTSKTFVTYEYYK